MSERPRTTRASGRGLPQPLLDRGGGRARSARRARHRVASSPRRCRRRCFRSASGRREFRVSVPSGSAATARELIASHLDEAAAAEIRRLSETLGPLEERIGYEFRDLGLLEHALTHRSRAHEDASGGVIDNESLEFLGDAVLGFVIADMLFHAVSDAQRGLQVEGQGRRSCRPPSLARLAEQIDLGPLRAAGPRRGEDRRPPQARDSRRQLRGADRGDLSRRRHRRGARRSSSRCSAR